MRSIRGRAGVSFGAVACALYAAPVLAQSAVTVPQPSAPAQQAPDTSQAEQDAAGPIGDIVVTAQKREESLQSTPVAVSAFTSDSLELKQISGVQQLQFNVPSLVFAQLTGYSQLSLRGIGSDLTVTAGEPTVATFQDGVYLGQLFAQSTPSFDLERVEVLRGPQGTLYGRNSTGGTINYITKAPSFTPGANLALLYGNYNHAVVEAGVTGPLAGDTVAGRLTVKYDRRDGYRRNLYDGRAYDANDQVSVQGSVLMKPSDDLSITLRGDNTRQISSPVQQFLAPLPNSAQQSAEAPLGLFSFPAAVLAGIPGALSAGDLVRLGSGSIADLFGLTAPGMPGPDPTRSTNIQNDFRSRTQVDLRGVSATIDAELGAVSVKSITAYRYSRLNIQMDSDGTSAAILNTDPIRQSSKQFTQEVTLSGRAFDDRLDWLVGGFYFHDKAKLQADLYLPALGDVIVAGGSFTNPNAPPLLDLSGPLISNLLQLTADPLLGTTLVGGTVPTTAFLGFGADQTSTSIAGFGQVTYKLTDRLRATGGLRYTRDTKEAFRRLHSNFVPAAALCETDTRRSWDAVTGTGGLDYDLTARTIAYAKVSRGYKAGGFNPAECTASFNPETLWAYEGGVKSTFAQGQARLNVAAFYYKFDNIQFTTYLNNSSTIKNAANATIFGIEAEYTIAPRALSGLVLDGSGSYIHSEYGDQLLQDPLGLATLNIGGNRLIRAPKWKLNFGAQYTFSSDNAGDFTLRGEGSYSSRVFNDVFNGKAPFQSATVQPGYWIANARLIWAPTDERFQAQLFVENITDKLYAFSRTATSTGGYLGGQFSAPRTFGARVSMKLGSAR